MSSIEMAANCHKDDARGLRNVSGWCHHKTRGYAAGSEAVW